jgi:hypothetical protein
MGHSNHAVSLQELWDEVEHLNRSVSALQTRLAQVQENAEPGQIERAESTTQAAPPWDVWPYTWAINLHRWQAARFHSFHENLFMWRLAKHNRRARMLFRRHAGTAGLPPRLV